MLKADKTHPQGAVSDMAIPPFVKTLALRYPELPAFARRTFRKLGVDLVNGINSEAAILTEFGITLLLDVGANTGQYAMRSRALGYQGRIVSFEPIASVYQQLSEAAKPQPQWETRPIGLGSRSEQLPIQVSDYSVYSSLLPPTSFLHQQYEGSQASKTELITIEPLDALFSQFYQPGDRVLLKLDVQGYEAAVLAGATQSLAQIDWLQLELSFVEHYVGEMLFPDMLAHLQQLGYTLIYLQPLSHNLSQGKVLQADGIFARLGKVQPSFQN